MTRLNFSAMSLKHLDLQKITTVGKFVAQMDETVTRPDFSPLIASTDFLDQPSMAEIAIETEHATRIITGADGGITFLTKYVLKLKSCC